MFQTGLLLAVCLLRHLEFSVLVAGMMFHPGRQWQVLPRLLVLTVLTVLTVLPVMPVLLPQLALAPPRARSRLC